MVIALLNKGADLKLEDYGKRTPLSVAEQSGNKELIDILRKAALKK